MVVSLLTCICINRPRWVSYFITVEPMYVKIYQKSVSLSNTSFIAQVAVLSSVSSISVQFKCKHRKINIHTWNWNSVPIYMIPLTKILYQFWQLVALRGLRSLYGFTGVRLWISNYSIILCGSITHRWLTSTDVSINRRSQAMIEKLQFIVLCGYDHWFMS